MEGSPRDEQTNPSQYEVSVPRITEVYERWVNNPGGRDSRIVTISAALADALHTDTKLQDITQEMVDMHQQSQSAASADFLNTHVGVSASLTAGKKFSRMPYPEYAANKLMRGFWHQWRMDRTETGWPQDFNNYNVCRRGIDKILNDPAKIEELEFNIIFRPVQSTVPSRAVGPKMIIQANRERFSQPRMVSVGHSLGLAEKKLLLNEHFAPVRILDWHGKSDLLENKPASSILLNYQLQQGLDFGGCVAIDLMPGDNDPASKEWALSSFTPKEQMNKKFMADAYRLASTIPDGYVSLMGDFSLAENMTEIRANLPGNGADIVLFSTVWYQNTPEDRAAMLKNALDILSEDGLIIIQDFVELRRMINKTPDSIESTILQLNFPHDWKPWTYKSLVLDPSRTGLEFQEAMSFIDGRCSSVRLSPEYRQKIFGY